MVEAVIVDAVRTPIGRALKGSLRAMRADELAAVPLRALIERNPAVDFAETADVMMGAASGTGEQGYNVGPQRPAARRHRRPRSGLHRQPFLRLVAADAADGVSRDRGRRGGAVHRGRRGIGVAGRARRGAGPGEPQPAARRLDGIAAATSTSRWE